MEKAETRKWLLALQGRRTAPDRPALDFLNENPINQKQADAGRKIPLRKEVKEDAAD